MTAWYDAAECAGLGADLFFSKDTVDQTRAKRVCAQCPVQWECLSTAVAEERESAEDPGNPLRFEVHGVRGGMSAQTRFLTIHLPARAANVQ
jgi:hypothetical protein